MKISNKGIELIKHFESLKLSPYLCSAGVPTIGYGSTKYENGRSVKMTDKPITKERADRLFLNTLVAYEDITNKEFKGVELSQNMFDAFVSFAYNTGGFRWNSGKSVYTFASFAKQDANKLKREVVDFLMSVSKYTDPETRELKTANGLRRRRMSEAILAYTGELVYFVADSWGAEKALMKDNYAKHTGKFVYKKLGL